MSDAAGNPAVVDAMRRLTNRVFQRTPCGTTLEVIAEATDKTTRIRFELSRNGVVTRAFRSPTILGGSAAEIERVADGVALELATPLRRQERRRRGKRE